MKVLKVTTEERQQIPHWQEASNNPTKPLPLSDGDQVILRVITDIGFTPSLRTMQRQLANIGFSCSPETIRKSYSRLSQGFAFQLAPTSAQRHLAFRPNQDSVRNQTSAFNGVDTI